MNISIQIIKQIINEEINLKSFNQNESREWLISNLINVLCDNKIFATTVKSTPIKKLNTLVYLKFQQIIKNRV